ncbi:4Fe-4S double cluster binding domain-containing protein [Chloroflexota bacterium]
MDIYEQIKQELNQYGYRFSTVSITHLSELQDVVAKLIRQGLVNKQLSEKWSFYLRTNERLPEAKTIIIAAIPQPITRIRFEWQGMAYLADIAPNYIYTEDEAQLEGILRGLLGDNGYRIVKASLALKTLAVHGGLAEYGRNNLVYVRGMGSFLRLIAFYTDCSCDEEDLREAKAMELCGKCTLCLENCPTGSVTEDRFLIRAENCLGWLNDLEQDNPYWVKYQPDWHNAFIGCMSCQFVCPVNKPYLNNIIGGSSFSEEETGQILDAVSVEELSSNILQKLGVSTGVYPLLPRNLRALIEKQNK